MSAIRFKGHNVRLRYRKPHWVWTLVMVIREEEEKNAQVDSVEFDLGPECEHSCWMG